MADFADLKPIITNSKRSGRRRQRGSSGPSKPEPATVDADETADELVIAGKKPRPVAGTPVRKRPSSKYYGMDDFYLDHETMDEYTWTALVGFSAIRVGSPMIFILHCTYLLAVLYFKHGFAIDEEASQTIPKLMLPLLANLLLVHVFNKWYFSTNYYRLREPH
ncbi:hypothetical protein KL918_002895 [Ogataea parapolymorpha]|uniref:Uncharacterized protein n=1 Tax=Ogataea parapolymorpha (strain ATCC 26012 / BCRC 20466 / JCM 22074 / NRRL Y-7560 / DL-1) TaxID=871575 RepID=W1QI33_OGAPD|nr:hypothetical protein HPODL_00652 [Ogataea parapolymorpha DL-1]ESX01255.1 hypothetical protein HPODL_00652 [Ogataea parapolymorpha DL-1]KAG7867456.1 hypothetical protein KL918_002895 [Ogataea parapolymorpha]KAG7871842.1 hypothetical protein KL916_003692 [Ogataea parapolymorpha]